MDIQEIVNNIKSKINHEFKKRLYRNLVFKGGGIRGIAYLGALNVLEEIGILQNIERVAGASAGAIAATLVSFRLGLQETNSLFNSLDFKNVPQRRTKNQGRLILDSLNDACYERFFKQFGYYSSEYFHEWLEATIAGQCGGNGRATFADFQARGFRDLYVVAANISRHRAETFSFEHTPDVAVADAVRMSMSIPLYFEALRFDGKQLGDGDFYVDGGLYDNFPMHIFDHPKFEKNNWAYNDGINWQTLGLFLFPDQIRKPLDPEVPTEVWDFLNLLLRNLYNAHQMSNYQTNPVDRHRTVEISDRGISAVEFNIEPMSEKYMALYNAGQTGVREFFEV